MNIYRSLKDSVAKMAQFVKANYQNEITEPIQIEFDILASQYAALFNQAEKEGLSKDQIEVALLEMTEVLKNEKVVQFYKKILPMAHLRFNKKQTSLN
jgi:hypothetical protein